MDEIENWRKWQGLYFKIVNGKVKPATMLEWAAQLGDIEARAVDRTAISEEVCVSTVFLGIDHGFGSDKPILFETMIFGGEYNDRQWRYASYGEAKRGHWQIVECLRKEEEPTTDQGEYNWVWDFLKMIQEEDQAGEEWKSDDEKKGPLAD